MKTKIYDDICINCKHLNVRKFSIIDNSKSWCSKRNEYVSSYGIKCSHRDFVLIKRKRAFKEDKTNE